jgi:ABC-type nitrate/sulfonate/bicarbonate transport system ATPase subunit
MSVEEPLLFTGEVYGLNAETTRTRTAQLLRALSLTHGRDTFAGQCSHGMRKKTAFAMALLPCPEALFPDEPFEAIDPVTSQSNVWPISSSWFAVAAWFGIRPPEDPERLGRSARFPATIFSSSA